MNYCEEKCISTSELNEAQRTLYYTAENMKMNKSISEEGYEHFQQAIKALEQEPILEKDGTLIVTTKHYKNVGRVLVQYGTNGTLFYQDQEPSKPMVEIDLYSVIKQKYIERDVLDKIRAEIEQEYSKFRDMSDKWSERANGLGTALEIIDKYKAESEDK